MGTLTDTREFITGLLNCEIGGLDCRVITTKYKHVSIEYPPNT